MENIKWQVVCVSVTYYIALLLLLHNITYYVLFFHSLLHNSAWSFSQGMSACQHSSTRISRKTKSQEQLLDGWMVRSLKQTTAALLTAHFAHSENQTNNIVEKHSPLPPPHY